MVVNKGCSCHVRTAFIYIYSGIEFLILQIQGVKRMHWETLPNWFWIIYYLFLLITLGASIFSVIRKKMKSLSILAIIFVITVPIISLINSIERPAGTNEFEYLINNLQQGFIWSIFIIIGYLFLLVWWLLFLLNSKTKS